MKRRALRPDTQIPELFLYRDPVDFRKSHQGLTSIVEMALGHDPFSGTLYAFTNRARNKIKILFWEDNGFGLYYKSLAEVKFRWPGPEDTTLSITGEQLNWLLDGYDIAAMQPHKTLQYETAC